MGVKSVYLDIISNRAGPWAAPVRWALSAVSFGYRHAVTRRNRRFDSGASPTIRLPIPVISIGNLTTGGTGKTPLVIDFAERCLRRGRKPAVVARGYKSPPGQSADELMMVSQRIPQALCIANPDRVAGGRDATRQGADVVILDDGFQHRRLARNLDVVIVDATNPFGFGRILPRGMLREPIGELRRADLIVISHADQVDSSDLHQLTAQLSTVAPDVPLVKCRHRAAGLADLSGTPCQQTYHRAVVFAAIGNPSGLVWTIKQMGIEPVKCIWWPDHHRYTARNVATLAAAASRVEHDVVLTTHKDAVKIGGLDTHRLEPLRMVRMDIEFLDGGQEVVDAHLDSILSPAVNARATKDHA